MKKKNNPFKMWGSYVGAVLAVAQTWFDFGVSIPNTVGNPLITNILGDFGCGTGWFSCLGRDITVNFVVLGIAGFLIGWGIHSLFRKFKKTKRKKKR